jgi:hypothetical protein|tara:strand:+ start:93696 stop:94064 length:369 start_codon:yes stop_codon:yes gene_type:complete
MTVLNRLKSIFSNAPDNDEVASRDLIGAHLKSVDDFRDFHLGNISSTDPNEKKEPYFKSISSEVHKNFVYAEERLADLLSEDDDGREILLKNDLEYDTDMQTSWTDAVSTVSQELSNDEIED